MAVSLDRARAAKSKVSDLFRGRDIVGVGITKIDDDYAVRVNLRQPIEPDTSVPEAIDGVPVQVEVVGEIRKQNPR